MQRAAMYLRVSSEEQTYENQRPDLERVVRTRGYALVETYAEHGSASKARPAFAAMMRDAHRVLTIASPRANSVKFTGEDRTPSR